MSVRMKYPYNQNNPFFDGQFHDIEPIRLIRINGNRDIYIMDYRDNTLGINMNTVLERRNGSFYKIPLKEYNAEWRKLYTQTSLLGNKVNTSILPDIIECDNIISIDDLIGKPKAHNLFDFIKDNFRNEVQTEAKPSRLIRIYHNLTDDKYYWDQYCTMMIGSNINALGKLLPDGTIEGKDGISYEINDINKYKYNNPPQLNKKKLVEVFYDDSGHYYIRTTTASLILDKSKVDIKYLPVIGKDNFYKLTNEELETIKQYHQIDYKHIGKVALYTKEQEKGTINCLNYVDASLILGESYEQNPDSYINITFENNVTPSKCYKLNEGTLDYLNRFYSLHQIKLAPKKRNIIVYHDEDNNYYVSRGVSFDAFGKISGIGYNLIDKEKTIIKDLVLMSPMQLEKLKNKYNMNIINVSRTITTVKDEQNDEKIDDEIYYSHNINNYFVSQSYADKLGIKGNLVNVNYRDYKLDGYLDRERKEKRMVMVSKESDKIKKVPGHKVKHIVVSSINNKIPVIIHTYTDQFGNHYAGPKVRHYIDTNIIQGEIVTLEDYDENGEKILKRHQLYKITPLLISMLSVSSKDKFPCLVNYGPINIIDAKIIDEEEIKKRR